MNRLTKLIALGAGSFAFLYQTNMLAFTRSYERSKVAQTDTQMLDNDISRIKLFSVTEHTELANEIAFYLKTKVGKLQVIRKDSATKPTVNIFEDVNSKEIFLVCSFHPDQESIKGSIDDLVTSIYTLKSHSASKVNVILPYYSNSHYHSENVLPFTEEELSDLLETAGADKIFTVNMHENEHKAPFHIPLVELDANNLCVKHFKGQQLKDLVIVYTNELLEEKVSHIKAKLEKQGHKVNTQLMTRIDESNLHQDNSIKGHDVLLVDNIVDSGEPLYSISNFLKKLGANSIHMFAIHGVMNNQTVDFLNYSPIKELVITNTLPLDTAHLSPKISQVSVAKMIANKIAQSTFHMNLEQLHQGKNAGSM